MKGWFAAALLVAAAVPAWAAGPRPGPEILYRAPATSSQLENGGIWKAPPILISGVSAYRSGEYLYQDYLYDDRGAQGRAVYPDEKARYAGNAADFVELRLKPAGNATAIRITFNSMLDPALVGTTIALGNSSAPLPAPFGAHAAMPAQVFVTVHGAAGVITDASSGKTIGKASVQVDKSRRQVDIRVPYAAFDPRGKTVRIAAATGLWDVAANAYLLPMTAPARARDGSPPPAPAPSTSSFFNVAFRFHEPLNSASAGSFWMDTNQADALAKGDLTPLYAEVDFRKLAAGTNDDSQVPVSGFMDRILASHFESAQGRGVSGTLGEGCHGCIPEFAGRLQPYEIYVPVKAPGASGYGLMLDLHSANANYDRWIGLNRQVDFGERGPATIVVTPEARGSDTWYYGQAAADTFEVWADVARRYKIDPDHVGIGGVSMGGYGGWKLVGQYPDLFAAAALDIPCPIGGVGYDGKNAPGGVNSFIYPMVPTYRQVPFMIWTAERDTTCSIANPHGQTEVMAQYAELGYRYVWFNFLNMPHASSNRFPNWRPFADFVAASHRDTVNPAHVNFAVNATMNEPGFGLVADHAYWLSGVVVRDAAASPIGTLDVFSHGRGHIDPAPTPKTMSTGVFQSDDPTFPWPNYHSEQIGWQPPPPATAPADSVDIKARNVAAMTIDPGRAGIDCKAKLNIDSDGPLRVTLLGCP